MLASGTVRREAGEGFAFRFLDVVAVSGGATPWSTATGSGRHPGRARETARRYERDGLYARDFGGPSARSRRWPARRRDPGEEVRLFLELRPTTGTGPTWPRAK